MQEQQRDRAEHPVTKWVSGLLLPWSCRDRGVKVLAFNALLCLAPLGAAASIDLINRGSVPTDRFYVGSPMYTSDACMKDGRSAASFSIVIAP